MKRYLILTTFALIMAGLLYLISLTISKPDTQDGVLVKIECENGRGMDEAGGRSQKTAG